MAGLFWIIIAIAVISSVVTLIMRLLNNLGEMNAARNRPQPRPEVGARREEREGGTVRQGKSDMDRFLAEIDRLRKKNANAPPPAPAAAGKSLPVAPVVQPTKQPERPRARVIAELAEPPRPDLGFGTPRPTDVGFGTPRPTGPAGPPAAPGNPSLPVATVVGAPAASTEPTTRVTRFTGRPRAAAKTPFAKALTGVLNSGQGLAIAVVLQEILGPPRCKKSTRGGESAQA